ncbi:MAG: protein kinase [Novosphingobium sp.]
MADDKGNSTPESTPGRTPPGDDRTVFLPIGSLLPKAGAPAEAAAPTEPAHPVSTPPASSRPSAIPEGTVGSRSGQEIQIGDVLNHIFEVKRFIARGGMGEVFEGINVNSDERVAIKVMLPNLSADANVLAMFRKEARTLTRLSHPALVQYRVFAQEPQLGVFYIVTEYVDGHNLSDVIKTLEPSVADLLALTRRLAEGLSAAHALGAIHRDMSPDNVMLEGGHLAGAKIIDFGIAKDLDPGSATIIGDGFAGKLNYVAPEQLGDFGRNIGPWTDIYSLGLVILAVSMRKDVNMGGTLVDAVDKRRAGPDLTLAPEELRPLLARMVMPNPLDRPASMGELLALLPQPAGSWTSPGLLREAAAPVDVTPAADPAPEASPIAEPEPIPEAEPLVEAEPVPETEPEPVAEPESPALQPAPDRSVIAEAPTPSEPAFVLPSKTVEPAPAPAKSRVPMLAGGGAVLLALAAAGAWYSSGSAPKGGGVAVESAPGASGDAVAASRTALASGLGSVGCTWLDITDIDPAGNGVSIALHGVAGHPAEAQRQIGQLLAARQVTVSALDFHNVSPIDATECGAIDALRQIRDTTGGRISVAQQQFELTRSAPGGPLAAKVVVNFDFGNAPPEMALFGVQPSGKISQLTTQRSELIAGSEDLGGGHYRLTLDVDHTGWSGLMLLSGKGPFDGGLTSASAGAHAGDWQQRFLQTARERGWKSEMVWFKTVDDQTN